MIGVVAGGPPVPADDDVRFLVRCEFDEFRRYYREAGWLPDVGEVEEMIIRRDPDALIVFRVAGRIVGHAIWHGSSTREMRAGDPRDANDTRILEGLLGGPAEFAELHELWLVREYRGKGIGRRFFDFFEAFIRSRGFSSIIYYAFDPAAVDLCRSRGYREAYGVETVGRMSYVLCLPLLKGPGQA